MTTHLYFRVATDVPYVLVYKPICAYLKNGQNGCSTNKPTPYRFPYVSSILIIKVSKILTLSYDILAEKLVCV